MIVFMSHGPACMMMLRSAVRKLNFLQEVERVPAWDLGYGVSPAFFQGAYLERCLNANIREIVINTVDKQLKDEGYRGASRRQPRNGTVNAVDIDDYDDEDAPSAVTILRCLRVVKMKRQTYARSRSAPVLPARGTAFSAVGQPKGEKALRRKPPEREKGSIDVDHVSNDDGSTRARLTLPWLSAERPRSSTLGLSRKAAIARDQATCRRLKNMGGS
ncbi:hypothetical protein FOL47_001191 [Perkinsus chesapeaki]|uniref:Uncharacterized protein n=1 Tax=Perkinsus chesapeaki TaxID=330153 RepID=A0A7J6MJP1_PERCH|nr:hypothetical protein FOL47_001191 [Perkinsus chesapeaki]